MAQKNSVIEVVSDSAATANSISVEGDVNEPIIADVFSASTYGNLEKLRKFVEIDGCSLSKPDVIGYYALQWASLNNFAGAAQYIIDHGADANAALHWAAVSGCIPELTTENQRETEMPRVTLPTTETGRPRGLTKSEREKKSSGGRQEVDFTGDVDSSVYSRNTYKQNSRASELKKLHPRFLKLD